MAQNITTQATVNLHVNGSAALTELEKLRAKASDLKKQINDIENGAGPKDQKKLTALYAEFKKVQTEITRCQTEVGRVNEILTRLDKASPRELTFALKKLKSELNVLDQGSDAWKSHVSKIHQVEMQLRRVNESLLVTEEEMAQTQEATKRVADVMRRLDRATPKELNQTLKTLKAQLNGLQRGTKTWDEHTRRIRLVEAELRRVNATLRTQETRWQRLNRFLNDTQTFFMGAAAAMTGFIMAGRKAVNAYAEMEEAMANTRKYTGMTAAQVNELNAAFKRMDTRLGREQLNALAQEGGRLGKSALEDVKGYVEAAQIINVALVDLGEGATQEIAKIANIFGDEKRLGTKEAMLSIGSAVNVLSQNCTASKPYLVEFTKRMAGIGSQAGMTVPEILAFGAVLDANGQKVEMSATAVQKVLMALANKNSEFSKVLGLDAQKLSETLKKSASEGLLMYLDGIRQLSDKTSAQNATVALAPLFKDMGMDAARVAAVLSTLATHIDEVRWQLGNSEKAFKEATSATREFSIFNNTTKAALEKAKYGVHELAVELGETLAPVMRHIYTSSSAFLRVLKAIIEFVAGHTTAILSLAAAITAYQVAVHAAAIKTAALTGAMKVAGAAMSMLRISATSLNLVLALLHGNMTRVRAAMRLLHATVSASPWGLLAAAIAAVTVKLIAVARESDRFKKKIEELSTVTQDMAKETMAEKNSLDKLFGALEGAKKGTKAYEDAKQNLLNQYGEYLGALVDEKGNIADLAGAYDLLSEAIDRSARARALSSNYQKIEDAYIEESAKSLAQLEESLRRRGASGKEVETVLSAVGEYQRTGGSLDDNAVGIINKYNRVMPQYDIDGQRRTYAGMLFDKTGAELGINEHSFRSPWHYVNAIARDRIAKTDSQERLRGMMGTPDGITRHGEDVTVEDQYKDLLESLDKAINNPAGGRVMLPHYYAPKVIPVTKTPLVLQSAADAKIGEADASSTVGTFSTEYMTPNHSLDAAKGGRYLTSQQAKEIKEKVLREMQLRKLNPYKTKSTGTGKEATGVDDDFSYVSEKEREKQERKAAAEARKEAVKARSDFKEGLAAIKAESERQQAELTASYGAGETDYVTYLEKRRDIELTALEQSREYYERHLGTIEDIDIQEDKDYQAIVQRREETELRYNEKIADHKSGRIKKTAEAEAEAAKVAAAETEHQTIADMDALEDKVTEIVTRSIEERQQLYARGTQKWEELQLEKEQTTSDAQLHKEKAHMERVSELRKKYDQLSASRKFEYEKTVLEELLKLQKITQEQFDMWLGELRRKYADELPGGGYERTPQERSEQVRRKSDKENAQIDAAVSSGVISEDEGKRRKQSLRHESMKEAVEAVKNSGSEWVSLIADLGMAWENLWTGIEQGGVNMLDRVGAVAQATFAAITQGMQIASQWAQASATIEVKKIEKRYERERELAQGNKALTTKMEKAKEKEVAEVKKRASDAAFRIQVIQSIAQAVTGSLNAYTSTAAIPVIGPVLAPAAAAVALAAGMANVALIKKQQEAASAEGFSSGGYTRPGRVDEEAGTVHAGEWVASQRLLQDPVARQVIERLELAQRHGDYRPIRMLSQRGYGGETVTAYNLSESLMDRSIKAARSVNTLGSLTMDDVRLLTSAVTPARRAANTVNAPAAGSDRPDHGQTDVYNGAAATDPRLVEILDRLSRRLDEPFTTVNTVSGEHGMRQALDRYDKLMRNKRQSR